jgi:hypothetical protein
MGKSNAIDILEIMLAAQEKSYEIAFETAVRTGTALIFNQNGKIVEIKPPFKYVMVPIESAKKTQKTPRKKK